MVKLSKSQSGLRAWGAGCIKGQFTLEWAVLLIAVVTAMLLMRPYVRDAMRANVKSTEIQLNTAMRDNRP